MGRPVESVLDAAAVNPAADDIAAGIDAEYISGSRPGYGNVDRCEVTVREQEPVLACRIAEKPTTRPSAVMARAAVNVAPGTTIGTNVPVTS